MFKKSGIGQGKEQNKHEEGSEKEEKGGDGGFAYRWSVTIEGDKEGGYTSLLLDGDTGKKQVRVSLEVGVNTAVISQADWVQLIVISLD